MENSPVKAKLDDIQSDAGTSLCVPDGAGLLNSVEIIPDIGIDRAILSLPRRNLTHSTQTEQDLGIKLDGSAISVSDMAPCFPEKAINVSDNSPSSLAPSFARPHDSNAIENGRDVATCMEEGTTNIGQLYSIAIQPTLQDDWHVENKSVVVDYNENSGPTRLDDDDYDFEDFDDDDDDEDDDQHNNNNISLRAKRILKKPTHRKRIDYEDLKLLFHTTRHDAAKRLLVSVSTLKRLCRSYGMLRWPRRKRREINHRHRNVIIKATYKDDIVKFWLSPLSGLYGLKENIGRRLELEIQSFRVEYMDDDGDLVLVACDDALQECLSIHHKSKFEFFVHPLQGNDG